MACLGAFFGAAIFSSSASSTTSASPSTTSASASTSSSLTSAGSSSLSLSASFSASLSASLSRSSVSGASAFAFADRFGGLAFLFGLLRDAKTDLSGRGNLRPRPHGVKRSGFWGVGRQPPAPVPVNGS
jgi:hypothetical protein